MPHKKNKRKAIQAAKRAQGLAPKPKKPGGYTIDHHPMPMGALSILAALHLFNKKDPAP